MTLLLTSSDMTASRMVLGHVTLLLVTWSVTGQQGQTKNYCQNQDLVATCPSNQVIVMVNATYGRMNNSGCISKNYGFIGCGTDVTGITDAECSGRHTCTVRVPNEMFDAVNTCPDDFKTYLEASYTCQKVMYHSSFTCGTTRFIKPTYQEGVLASVVTMETKCGSTTSPYVIEGEAGQRISITLVDFSYHERQHPKPGDDVARCEAYATFNEKNGLKSETLCGRDKRESQVYVSQGNKVQVTIMTRTQPKYFLLKYKVFGCATPITPPFSTLRRDGDKVTVSCNHSSDTWRIKCINTTWIGHVGNCSETPNVKGVHGATGFSLNYELAIVMIVAIALVIACCILCVGVVWMKGACRKPFKYPPPSSTTVDPRLQYDIRPEYMDHGFDNYSRKDVELAWNYDQYRGENVYASIQETPTLPRSIKSHSCDAGHALSPTGDKMPPREVGLLMPYSSLDLQTGLPCATLGPCGSLHDTPTVHLPQREAYREYKESAVPSCGPTRQYFVLDTKSVEKPSRFIETQPPDDH